MSSEGVARRTLELSDLDDVVREAESLLASGYDKAGNWDLGQVCGHVADWMSYPLDGFATPPLPIRMMLGAMRLTLGKRMLRKILETRSMTSNNPTMRETIPAPGGDEAAAVARLREVAQRLRDHQGPLHPSPLFGKLDHETLVKLNTIHAAHHLSFLVPRG
jgi:hypothetical protein